jgi:hypothetical protein
LCQSRLESQLLESLGLDELDGNVPGSAVFAPGMVFFKNEHNGGREEE